MLPALIGLMAVGLVLLAGGTVLVIVGSRGAGPAAEPLPAAAGGVAGAGAPAPGGADRTGRRGAAAGRAVPAAC